MRRILNPHLVVSGIQIIVAVVGTAGILSAGRTEALEMGLGAVLVLADSFVPAAVNSAITRRHAAMQVRAALTSAERASGSDVPPVTPA